MNWKNLLAAALLVTGVSAGAWAQQPGGLPTPVTAYPTPATSAGGNVSGTIASTGAFQKLWGATGGSAGPFRKGCTIQNNGTHNMNVSEGLGVAGSTTGNSVVVPAGGIYYCQVGQIVLTGEIDITGTATDAFYAAQY